MSAREESHPFPLSEFQSYQGKRRRELWSLLGHLPWKHKPGPARLIRTERRDGCTLERIVLDLNGVELFDGPDEETPAMRQRVLQWLDEQMVRPGQTASHHI